MNAKEIRKKFLTFFESKLHKTVPSAPMVVKDDPTLMFTNAGMNQFKDLFLGISPIQYKRIANSQKCLRVSGKHNDLEEVGHDTYHHTMFEMLGNWSFGDYFKKEAIDWAWELLTEVYKIPVDRLYATIFEGSSDENIDCDFEAKELWKKYLPEDRIINGSKKDNFWEMGDTGPCGPCSEIHVDLRSDEIRNQKAGRDLVNQSDPHVIEIWNLVFIQYNRKASGELEQLPAQHVDTGMGFERLCMVIQKKLSNYDTDVFQPIIQEIASLSKIQYGKDSKSDIAMRVIADHLRTISFSIADGQLPSNAKAGYVIRRILRRAVRYGYTYLGFSEPFIASLLPVLIDTMGETYPELLAQKILIEKVITEEELSFLKTLETGIKLLDQISSKVDPSGLVSGKLAFELYDTYGFPVDLTELILKEKNMGINKQEFEDEMKIQKERSRSAATLETGDWIELIDNQQVEFVGYDTLQADIRISRYRKIKSKGKDFFQLVFNKTPFYAESGGQVGDTGYIESENEKIEITDTKKENNLIVHFVDKIPELITANFTAVVNSGKRISTQCNHSATHLLHEALREILGTHVEQKGSFVNDEQIRFDFAHFQKMSSEEIRSVERLVNQKIRMDFPLEEQRSVEFMKAKEMGAMALFGEKYGETVRMIKFGSSVELCGGTHIASTGRIGFFKILSEGSISAGIRRIEAITSNKAENLFYENYDTINQIFEILKVNKDLIKNLQNLVDENASLSKEIEKIEKLKLIQIAEDLQKNVIGRKGINFISAKIMVNSANALKEIAFELKTRVDNIYLVLGAEIEGKANIALMISENLVQNYNLNAANIIRDAAKEIQGGGGGQTYFATAGGKNPDGLDACIAKVLEVIENKIK